MTHLNVILLLDEISNWLLPYIYCLNNLSLFLCYLSVARGHKLKFTPYDFVLYDIFLSETNKYATSSHDSNYSSYITPIISALRVQKRNYCCRRHNITSSLPWITQWIEELLSPCKTSCEFLYLCMRFRLQVFEQTFYKWMSDSTCILWALSNMLKHHRHQCFRFLRNNSFPWNANIEQNILMRANLIELHNTVRRTFLGSSTLQWQCWFHWVMS